MTESLTITLTNKLAEVERLGTLISAFGARHSLPGSITFYLTLALDEVVTNIIRYAYDDQNAHEILVRVTLDNGLVTARVDDDGREFNPLEAPPVDLDAHFADRPIGGLGIHMVKSMMDTLEYQRAANRNILVLKKAVPAS